MRKQENKRTCKQESKRMCKQENKRISRQKIKESADRKIKRIVQIGKINRIKNNINKLSHFFDIFDAKLVRFELVEL